VRFILYLPFNNAIAAVCHEEHDSPEPASVLELLGLPWTTWQPCGDIKACRNSLNTWLSL